MAVKNADILNPIKKFTIGDGYKNLVVDLENSEGPWLVDGISGERYLDFFSFYASAPVGFNHPSMVNDEDFLRNLKYAAINKVSNSDFYTESFANFVDTFSKIAKPDLFKYLFFISGGALAVENSLKAAFDWKVRKNFEKGYEGEQGSKIIHFKDAFHGRSGYTLSLTNTADPRKYQYFPKFKWPRVENPKIIHPLNDHLEEIEKAEQNSLDEIIDAFNKNKDDIAAIIIEPIQGEGGDNHFRGEFLRELRQISDERDAMLIYDEVQTGIALTGKMWAFEHFKGAEPDIIAFGKKTQVCGFMANDRIDEVENNVFNESSRINSTWGGNLVDMVRSEKILKIIKEDDLIKNAEKLGEYLINRLHELETKHEEITNVRGRGLFAAMDLPTSEARDNLKKSFYEKKLILLGSGIKSIRFRPPLIIEKDHIDKMIEIVDEVITEKYD